MKRLSPRIARTSRAATLRVAVYARQSVEDSTSEFGSLEAQREAVEAYVKSQASLGWVALPERFDDAGFSGSNIQRPAFQRLLALVRAGEVDVVATYKLDRVSRSLADFVGIMQVFREHNTDFVSVTQGFSTSTSVGRMTINLLATFAEFERESISERTRDKMCAARRRGLWTGGPVPLGYDLRDKRLMPNDEEAAHVRALFATFVEMASVIGTIERTNAMCVQSKSWTTEAGKVIEPRPFTKATMRALLANPVYIGRIRLGDETHAGAHAAIVDVATFEAAQELLSRRDAQAAPKAAPEHSVLLRGLVECAVCGSAYKTAWTKRRARFHGSYLCSKADKQGASACPGSRVPVTKLEAAVVKRVRFIGRDPELVEQTIQAARKSIDARVPELTVAIRRHEQDRARLERQRANLLEAVAENGGKSLNGKLAQIDEQITEVDGRIVAALADRERLLSSTIDEAELRRLLTDFDPLWAAMFPSERARVLALLIERITVNGPTGDVEMHIRGCDS